MRRPSKAEGNDPGFRLSSPRLFFIANAIDAIDIACELDLPPEGWAFTVWRRAVILIAIGRVAIQTRISRQVRRTHFPMSLSDMVEKGLIVPIEVPLGPREQPARLLYGTPDFIRWLDDRLHLNETSPLRADMTPAEQLDNLFYIFVSGRRLVYSRQFRYIKAEKHAVWELKTSDFRIFGWFPIRDCFISVFGDWADRVKDHDLYRGYRLETRRVRREMGIDDQSCVQGVDPSDVISS
jgi:hypothetical protein